MAKPLLGHQSMEGDPSIKPAAGRTIGVLGSGDFARSLAIRLVCSGLKVVVGSRNPKRKAGLFPSAAEVTFQAEAVKKTDVIFVAVFREHYSTLCDLADLLAGKILVDVSNNSEFNHHKESNAEYLASLFPACTVVKGFNVVSAWTLQSGARDGNKQVLFSSDKSQIPSISAAEVWQHQQNSLMPQEKGSECWLGIQRPPHSFCMVFCSEMKCPHFTLCSLSNLCLSEKYYLSVYLSKHSQQNKLVVHT